MPVRPAWFLVPDWMVRGDSLAQETRRPGVGNLLISRPISAMMPWAVGRLIPGISSRRSRAGRIRASGPVPALGPVLPSGSAPQAVLIAVTCSSIRVVSVLIWVVRASI